MIVVVGLNPALDVTYQVSQLAAGTSHRVRTVSTRAGGKAGNVARVLRLLGTDVFLTGLTAGETGDRLARDFAAAGISAEFTVVAGETRRSVTVVDDRSATVFNEPGPFIDASDWDRFRVAVSSRIRSAAALVLTGSLPPGLPAAAYGELVATAREAGVPVLVDAGGDALAHSLAADLVKPNATEAACAVGFPVDDVPCAVRAARSLRDSGAAAAVISLGEQGLIAVAGERAIGARLDHHINGNPTGAGDALAATLAQALAHSSTGSAAFDWPEVMRTGIAVSAAAVASPLAGDVDLDLARRLRSRVIVEEIPLSTVTERDAAPPVDASDGDTSGEDEGDTRCRPGEVGGSNA